MIDGGFAPGPRHLAAGLGDDHNTQVYVDYRPTCLSLTPQRGASRTRCRHITYACGEHRSLALLLAPSVLDSTAQAPSGCTARVSPGLALACPIILSNQVRRQRCAILTVGFASFEKVCSAFAAPHHTRMKMQCLHVDTWSSVGSALYFNVLRCWCW